MRFAVLQSPLTKIRVALDLDFEEQLLRVCAPEAMSLKQFNATAYETPV